MIEALFEGLTLVLQWKPLAFMMLGIVLGFWVGLLPGLGGATTLALMLPFIYAMQPVEAFAFLLGMHAVVATTGDITSVLFGVPGEAASAATILDGHAMAKKGEAGRALGAALASSLVGAMVGAFALAIAIPMVRPLVLTFGSPELFMLAIVGIAFIASLSAPGVRGMVRGFLSGGLGLLCATVGQDPQAGIARYTFDSLYLWGGLDLVPVLVGIFAIPEIIDLAIRRTSIAGTLPAGRVSKGALEGVKDTFRHFWLTIRCSLIGTFIGIMPGMGGAVAQWMAYGHATQSARNAEERKGFGAGRRARRARARSGQQLQGRRLAHPDGRLRRAGQHGDGDPPGRLLPARPRPRAGHADQAPAGDLLDGLDHRDRQRRHRDRVLPLSRSPGALTTVRGTVLIPVILVLIFIGSYTSNNHYGDIRPHPGVRRHRLPHGGRRLAARAVRARPGARQDRRELPLHLGGPLRRGLAYAAGGAGADRDRARGHPLAAGAAAPEGGACIERFARAWRSE